MTQTKLQIKTTGIDHVVLWTADLARAKRFYMDVLGMTLHQETKDQIFLKCGDHNMVALFDGGQRGIDVTSNHELQHMALNMELASYEETAARLEEEGCEITHRGADPYCIYFRDPDGHRLQLLYSGHE